MGYLSVFPALVAVIFLGLVASGDELQAKETYGAYLCGQRDFYCIRIQRENIRPRAERGKALLATAYRVTNLQTTRTTRWAHTPTWYDLWPDAREEAIVRKVNRMNTPIRPGMVLAVPLDTKGKTFMDYSPFPSTIAPREDKLVIWDPRLLAWAGYDRGGALLRWGPGVGGAEYCKDVGRRCRTVVGSFEILAKKGRWARSTKYPLGCKGNQCAPMPYFLPFHGSGYGFHGSTDVPGKNVSHGCVRVFLSDAEWLDNFTEVGTDVLIRPYAR